MSLLRDLRRLLGRDGLLVDAAARAVYARDASHLSLGVPLAVALPRDARQAATVVAACARHGVPWVPRGAGTGLSGGAVPGDGALVISAARLETIVLAAMPDRAARVGAGVVNERLSRAVAGRGLCFAPDPSSQSAATLGGNIAENAGGPHTLKVGVTVNHVLAVDWVDAAGQPHATGPGLPFERGFDLRALLVGSEGTLGFVTGAVARLSPVPPCLATLLALFPRLDDATRAVVTLMGEGLLPEAVEMIDQGMLEAVEEAFRFGFPTDVEVALIVEFGGLVEGVGEDAARAQQLLTAGGAREVRRARDEAERVALWRCRKKAFGAVGRLAPNYVTMDIVVPLARLPEIVRTVGDIGNGHGVHVATAFHAGDGNLHPGVHFDDRDPDSTRRAHLAADEILCATLALGGSITGEHGIGIEKRHLIGRQLDPVAADLMHGIKRLFDPRGLANPGKALPPLPPSPVAASTGAARAPVPTTTRFAWDSLTVTVPGDAELAGVQAEALARGFWIPCGALLPAGAGVGLGTAGPLRAVIDRGVAGPSLLGTAAVRDCLVELWGTTGDGRALHAGAPVFKNVAGYDLVRLVCGAGGALARIDGATFQLKPAPECAALWWLRGACPDQAFAPHVLLRELAGWGADLAGPVVVVECGAEAPDRWTVLVMAGGRNRPWDLGRGEARLVAALAGLGLLSVETRRVPFAAAAGFAAHPSWPAWTRRGDDWTILASLAPSGAPPGLSRWILQARPWLFWTPAIMSPPVGWHADGVVRDGAFTEPPPPVDPGVLPLLAGLKALFDPDDRLPRPSWLPRAAAGAS